MRFKLLLSMVMAITTTAGLCAPADFVGSSGSLSIDRTTVVPGDMLKAGSYLISVTEQLSDRMIIRIDSTTSKNHAIFLGVPSTTTKLGGGSGSVAWGVGVNKTQTMRGFVFPNGNIVEFVYPKAEAAALAKQNGATVIGLDPRSEGKVALKGLSQDELAIVNLWLLSMTTTGADSKTPAVLAKHYDGAQSVTQPVVAASVQPVYPIAPRVASTPVERPVLASAVPLQKTPVAKTQASRKGAVAVSKAAPLAEEPSPGVAVARPALATPSQVARLEEPTMPNAAAGSIRQNRAITQLPHTASTLPLVWMVGLMSFLGAGLARIGRAWITQRVQG